VRASKGPLSGNTGGACALYRKLSMYTRFLTRVGLRCMDIFYLALASALKEHLMSFRMTFCGALKDPLSEKVGASALRSRKRVCILAFSKCSV